ncbi:hypothetical protein LLEC1_02736 [Akanthomyces lecanii]|uniref:BHLH domain-containing protein n=1 Tax=Cordyceps confragosa TaxID=2714763 RepID=A0A179IDZ8_CORDF|nr:hypothetical protein LLEC1_02736 [Akanthomyces lecanii]
MPLPDSSPITAQYDPNGVLPIETIQPIFNGQYIYQAVALQDEGYDTDRLTWQKYIPTKSTTSTDSDPALHHHQPASFNFHITNPTKQGAHMWGCPLPISQNQTSAQYGKEILPNEDVIAKAHESTLALVGWACPPWGSLPAQNFAENGAQWAGVQTLGAGTRFAQQQVNLGDATTVDLESMPFSQEEGTRQQELGDDANVALSDGYGSSQAYSPTPSLENRPRKKLTVEQKRSNHIRYEKRRRALIRDRFTALAELLPGLDAENCSKSRTLFSAVEQLQILLEKNKALQEQVDMLTRDK